jgi:hypothetical protein
MTNKNIPDNPEGLFRWLIITIPLGLLYLFLIGDGSIPPNILMIVFVVSLISILTRPWIGISRWIKFQKFRRNTIRRFKQENRTDYKKELQDICDNWWVETLLKDLKEDDD